MRLVQLLVLPLLALSGCAHVGAPATPQTLASIDVQRADGTVTRLSDHLGKLVVLDVCAAWSNPCLLNARAVDQVCQAACGDDVVVISMLLDEPGAPALLSYRDVLGASQTLVLPGPDAVAGRSVLGSLAGIPRLVIFDREGRIAEDITGGVVSPAGILRRLDELGR